MPWAAALVSELRLEQGHQRQCAASGQVEVPVAANLCWKPVAGTRMPHFGERQGMIASPNLLKEGIGQNGPAMGAQEHVETVGSTANQLRPARIKIAWVRQRGSNRHALSGTKRAKHGENKQTVSASYHKTARHGTACFGARDRRQLPFPIVLPQQRSRSIFPLPQRPPDQRCALSGRPLAHEERSVVVRPAGVPRDSSQVPPHFVVATLEYSKQLVVVMPQ
jgi:hypothetical protein